MVNLDFNVLVFLTGFVFALPIIGYLFRFQIPISIFFLLAGTFMIAIFLATDTIILSYDQLTNSTQIQEVIVSNTTTYHYIVESGSTNSPVGNYTGVAFARGIHAFTNSILIGDNLQCIEFKLQKVGNPDLDSFIQVGIFTNNKELVQLYGVLNVTQISTTAGYYPVCVPEGQERIIQLTDKIGLKWEDSQANATNHIRMFIDNANPFDGTDTRRGAIVVGTNTWVATTTDDHTARLYDFEIDTAIIEDFNQSIQPNEMDFTFTGENFQLKVIMIFVSVMFMVGGALVEVKQR